MKKLLFAAAYFVMSYSLYPLSGFSQNGNYYERYPRNQICYDLLIGDFDCINCSQTDNDRFQIPQDVREDVAEIISKYIHCSIVNRRRIADLLSLGQNEQAITSLSELSSSQISQITQITKAKRVLFGSLRIQPNETLLVSLEVVNLSTSDIEGKQRFEIPENKYRSYSERVVFVEENVKRLILGEQNTPLPSPSENVLGQENSIRPKKKDIDEVSEWNETLLAHSIEAYQEYLKKYPAGKYVQDAENRLGELKERQKEEEDNDAWWKAQRADTKHAYQSYREDHPDGRHYSEADARIRQLEEREREKADRSAWQKAGRNGSIAAYREYQRNYSSGKYYDEAKNRIRQIEERQKREEDEASWRNAQSKNTMDAYQNYLDEHPYGLYSDQARKKIDDHKLMYTGVSKVLQILPVSGLRANSSRNYQLQFNLQNGSKVYSDRDYVCNSVPNYIKGNNYIITANEDKWVKGNNFIEFTANQNIRVFVAYDEGYPQKPQWLLNYFQKTSYRVNVDRGTYALYDRTYNKGELVSLGGNYAYNANHNGSMYFVVIKGI